jgi:hypothetical protein
MLYKEKIVMYSDNHLKPINTLCLNNLEFCMLNQMVGLNIVTAGL